jgi:high affinity sulfate transporter 1
MSTEAAQLRSRKGSFSLARHIPILSWLPRYKASWLSADLIAGLSVWALLVPQGIAYSSIAGVPPQYGLYTALGALVGYALFGTSRQLITGPSATVAAVSFSLVTLLATDPSSSEWVGFTAALALMAGLIYVLLGLLRMGWISNFLSKAVLEGFIFAFGIGLMVDQSHKLLGVPKVDGSYWDVLVGTVREIGQTNVYTLAVGVGALALLLLMRRFAPKLPRALIVVVLGILVATLLPLNADYGVKIVGAVPTGLPSLAVPAAPVSDWGTLLIGALAVIFVGFSETLAAGREVASKHDYELDVSQEMIAQGMACGASSLMGGYVVDGSLSKTTVADLAGQKTQMASLITAGFILLTILFLAGLFTNLPEAVLGAVVIDAAIGLVKLPVLRRVRATSRVDFAAFAAAGLGLFFVGILVGVLFGVILSLLLLIWAVSKSPVRRMGLDASENVYVDLESHPDAVAPDGVLVAEIAGPLFFADAAPFRQAVLDMVADQGPRAVVIDLGSASQMDMDGAEVLTKLHEELERKGIQVVLARVPNSARELLRKVGTEAEIGKGNFFVTVRDAVVAVSTLPVSVPSGTVANVVEG